LTEQYLDQMKNIYDPAQGALCNSGETACLIGKRRWWRAMRWWSRSQTSSPVRWTSLIGSLSFVCPRTHRVAAVGQARLPPSPRAGELYLYRRCEKIVDFRGWPKGTR